MFWLNCFRLTPAGLFEWSGTYLNSHLGEMFLFFWYWQAALLLFLNLIASKLQAACRGEPGHSLGCSWISCSLQQKKRISKLLNNIEKVYFRVFVWKNILDNLTKYEIFQCFDWIVSDDVITIISPKLVISEKLHIPLKFSCPFGTGKLQLFHRFLTSSHQIYKLHAGGNQAIC
jgi:hypothetical protein